MRKFRRLVGTISSLMGLAACGSAPKSDGELKLTNAIAIDEGEFPAVVLLYHKHPTRPTFCTGTFLNDHQVLTAAHCVDEEDAEGHELFLVRPSQDASGVTSMQVQARAIRTHVHPGFASDTRNDFSPFDIAIVDFPGGSAPGVLKLADQSPSLHDKVTLVGYGNDSAITHGTQSAPTAGLKHYGSNSVRSVDQGLLSLAGLSRTRSSFPLGQHVASTQGDSGSPWLKDGNIASMTVGGEVKQMGQGQELGFTYAIDLNAESSRTFLASIVD